MPDRLWPDDLTIRDAHNDMIAQLEKIQDSPPSPSAYGAAHSSELHLNCVLALDPEKIEAEYHRMFQAQQDLGNPEGALAQIQLTRDHLVAWKGEAADQFRMQLTYMQTFCAIEKDLLGEALRSVAAAYAAAVAARINLHGLLEAAAAAARNVLDGQKTKETQAAVVAIADIVKGVLDWDPRNPVKSVGDAVIDLGKDLATTIFLDDSGADQVCDDYTRRGERLCQELGHAYDHIQRNFVDIRDMANRPPELFRPLPAYCDVASPDFSYDRFKDTIHDPGPIGPDVEAERRKYAEEKAKDSEIDKRLNRGDHGAV